MFSKTFFKPTRNKVLISLVAVFILPLILIQYLAMVPPSDKVTVLSYFAALFFGSEAPSQPAIMGTSVGYVVLAGLPMYLLVCFFAEHRKRIHPHL